MPVIPMQEILRDAFQKRYGVGAFNIVNDLTMDAVLAAAEETRSPVIVQVSVKTVKQMGARLIRIMFAEMARRVSIPATLHLDHCPDRKVLEECIAEGWNSVLFDASKLTYEDNLAQTKEVVALAHRHGVAVEGELEAITGVEDGVGDQYRSEEHTSELQSLRHLVCRLLLEKKRKTVLPVAYAGSPDTARARRRYRLEH